MKTRTILIGFGIVAVILLAIYFINSNTPGKYDDFAKCLKSKGISMGGTDWCPHCKEQKALFGKSFRYVDFHNCDYERNWCIENGVNLFPTWVLPDGETLVGVQTLDSLSFMSGCEL